LDILENNGISEFGEVGEDVDFKKHEILEEVDGGEKDKVVQVVQKGYKMGEKIIRPAKVKVGK
jgi:molecular chaperone GrpE